ncbi:MAG TPA: hypothetical protein VFN94_00040 [Nitrospiria bacterium]|nr:hypothetical protein [Nitrospiria bacterium]
MFERLRELLHEAWRPVLGWHLAVASLGFAWIMYVHKTAPSGWVRIIDDANLVFHEAGHPIFGLFFGSTLGLYGGTLGQLAIPFGIAVAFWVKREAVGFAVTGFWFSENFLNIARYMADARAQVLPLVGGGEHDWTNIFSRWGVLASDTTIAGFAAGLGWLGMIGAWGWLGWHWLASRADQQDEAVDIPSRWNAR